MIIMTARARKFDNLYKGPPPNTLPQGPHQPKSGPGSAYVFVCSIATALHLDITRLPARVVI